MWRVGFLLFLLMCGVAVFRCASPVGQEQPQQETISALEQVPSGESLDAEVVQESMRTENQTSEADPLPDSSVLPDSSMVPESSVDSLGPEFFSEATKEAIVPDVAVQDGVFSEGQTQAEQGAKSCVFNVDCATAERCECDESTGCFCKPGVRGTGKNGVDVCKTGNDCESSLCNEGSDGKFYCSGPCNQDTDCAAMLPICANISFVGKICIRKKP